MPPASASRPNRGVLARIAAVGGLAGRFRVEGTEDPLIERRHQGGEAHRRPLAGVTVRERLSSMTLKTRL